MGVIVTCASALALAGLVVGPLLIVQTDHGDTRSIGVAWTAISAFAVLFLCAVGTHWMRYRHLYQHADTEAV